MKIFIVDILKCLDLSHYEPFFYEDIKADRLSLFNQSLNSIDELDRVYDWLQAEINRSPFSITKGLVAFYIPRNLTAPIGLYDVDLIINVFIYQKILRKLDSRFSFVCFYLDRTGADSINSAAYKRISDENENFFTDSPALLNGKFPRDMMGAQLSFEQIREQINAVREPTLREYYSDILDRVIMSNGSGDKATNMTVFQNELISCVPKIRSVKVPHFGSDISEKTRGLLKLVDYICNTAKRCTDENFDTVVNEFISLNNLVSYEPDYNKLKNIIPTYKKRLRDWIRANQSFESGNNEEIKPIEYTPTDYSKDFDTDIDMTAVIRSVEEAMSLSFKELVSFELTDIVFQKIDVSISESDERLRKFGERVVGHMREFCAKHNIFVTEPSRKPEYIESELSSSSEKEKELNHYSLNDLPGYPAEVKLRQELDAISSRIKDIGERAKRYKAKLFSGAFLFSFLSVFLFYLTSQYSVFLKEGTWWVFGLFDLIVAALFLLGYAGVKKKYLHMTKELLKEALEKVKEFLTNYKKRAKELEDNVNNAMLYSCLTEQQNRITVRRHEEKALTERYQWHKLKILAILKNMEFFASFVGNTEPANETSVPELMPFEGDAADSEFYQTKIFSQY